VGKKINQGFKKRLKQSWENRDKFKIKSKKHLAELADVKYNTIMRWFRGEDISKENAILLAELLNVDFMWLFTGERTTQVREFETEYIEKKDSNVEPAYLKISNEVPIISWVQAGEMHVAFVEEDLDEIEKFTTYVNCSKDSYALRITGDSMTTSVGPYSFPEGTVIVVDPEQKGDLTNGVFVIAKKVGEDGVHFKQLKYEQGRPYLNSLNPNPDYKNYYGEFRVIGKVVDYKPFKLP